MATQNAVICEEHAETRVATPWAPRAFRALVEGIQRILPAPVRRYVPMTFIGYALINGSAFIVDISFLHLFHSVIHWPYAVAVTLGYALAGIYSLTLNKWLNFQVPGHVLLHGARYTVGLIAQYVIFVLGLSVFLHSLGVPAEIARVSSACCEGIFLYVLMRLWVFRTSRVTH